ncbi:MAG: right-handed parallel beta-helix repeat-containing protein [Bacteroidaceae bacterium]|nr:right-handed parallel beta-helix repeat-containing protein [Bacteroidaceae bacterium]
MRKIFFAVCSSLMLFLTSCGTGEKFYYGADFGIVPGTGEDMTQEFALAFETIKAECKGEIPAELLIDSGEYDFYPDSALVREYYVSNHDQDNPKRVAIVLEGMKNFTLKSRPTHSGSEYANFMMNGRMLPVAMVGCENCTLDGIAVDTRVPQITQVEVLENAGGYITYRIAPYVNYKVVDGRLVVGGSNWEFTPSWGIAFEGDTKHIIYTTSDIGVGTSGVEEVEPFVIRAPWNDTRLVPGSVIAMRSYARPTPGIFVTECKNTNLLNSRVFYAEGMGLLAQMSENITLDRFRVSLRDNERYFTTQADATHFSGCKGKITSVNGFYEGMMDDAINVHGTYLRVTQRLDDNTLVGRYMHGQAYGFYWGGAGDSVQFVRSDVMEITEGNRVVEIAPYDKEQLAGCKEFKIKFEKPLPADIANGKYGIENLEWTPEVYFAGNTIRNNRARGALFSTPKSTLVENNLFDHTSGTAILLCGDCNGWFETGACRDVVIRNNRFVNALTSMFQFTNGIISIYPEIPDLASQTKYFHGGNGKGVVIENNVFETFDAPIVYAKSLDGLVFRGNKVVQNNDFKPFHWNKHRFLLEKVTNVTIEDNEFSNGFDEQKDVMCRN